MKAAAQAGGAHDVKGGAPASEIMDEVTLRRLAILVEQYVEVRSRRHDFVSTRAAARAIRQVVDASIGDEDLDTMIASVAIGKGLAVSFDRDRPAGQSKPLPFGKMPR